MTKIFFIILTLIISISANAGNKKKPKNFCTPSKHYINNYEPEKFPNTNNLLRTAGDKPFICGTKIVIRGKLTDKNCVPISDAKIAIWQKACDGKYPYKPMRNNLNPDLINLDSASTFLGAGSTTTDNKGEFYFITTIPGCSDNEHPHVNVKITHQYFEDFYTKFDLSKNNTQDPPLKLETPKLRIDGSLLNEFIITLPEKHPLREL
jgi:protocatechuate 3,4-dioxygenase beta subunit